MEINGEYIDYADGIYELENCFGPEFEDGDYFTFWENCERIPEIQKCNAEHRLYEKVLDIYKKLGKNQKERSENIWNMEY